MGLRVWGVGFGVVSTFQRSRTCVSDTAAFCAHPDATRQHWSVLISIGQHSPATSVHSPASFSYTLWTCVSDTAAFCARPDTTRQHLSALVLSGGMFLLGFGFWASGFRVSDFGLRVALHLEEREDVAATVPAAAHERPCHVVSCPKREREFFIDNLLVRIHFIIVLIGWTGLAPWEFEICFSGSLPSLPAPGDHAQT